MQLPDLGSRDEVMKTLKLAAMSYWLPTSDSLRQPEYGLRPPMNLTQM
jgi:hypothetical protein